MIFDSYNPINKHGLSTRNHYYPTKKMPFYKKTILIYQSRINTAPEKTMQFIICFYQVFIQSNLLTTN